MPSIWCRLDGMRNQSCSCVWSKCHLGKLCEFNVKLYSKDLIAPDIDTLDFSLCKGGIPLDLLARSIAWHLRRRGILQAAQGESTLFSGCHLQKKEIMCSSTCYYNLDSYSIILQLCLGRMPITN